MIDPAYMSFGLNLAQGYMKTRQVSAQNDVIEMSNAIHVQQVEEQIKYEGVNYRSTLEELHRADLNTAVQKMVLESEAQVQAAVGIGSAEEADLQIARDAGRNTVAIQAERKAANYNHQNQRKALNVQKVSGQRLKIPQGNAAEVIATAGTQTYFDMLQSGLIS